MKIPSTAFALLAFLAVAATAIAGKPLWPKQPKLSSAYESFAVALRQIDKGSAGEPAKHLANANAALNSAKVDLETAKKNKGSARIEAIKQADLALEGIKVGKLDEASAAIARAMEYVTRAADNGR